MTGNKDVFLGCLCATGCETLFGLSYIFTKQATESASEFALLGWRFLIAAIVMSLSVILGFIKINLKGKSIKPLLLVALFSPCLYFIGETIGISKTTASESGVFLACIPVAALTASSIILKKRPAKLQTGGVLITLIGIIFTVVAVGMDASLSILGYLFLMIAVASYAMYSVFVDKASEYTGAEITYIMLLAGAAVFILLAIIEAVINHSFADLTILPFVNMDFLVAILYQGIGCSVIAFFLSNIAISKIGVNRAASFIGVSTAVSIAAGAFLLKESFSLYQLIGAAVIIFGVYVANSKVKVQ